MSGVLHKGVCYPTLPDARQAACSDYPLIWASGSSTYSLSCAPSMDLASESMTMCKSVDGGACATILQPWPSAPSCDFSGGTDLAMDWGLVGLSMLVVIYGLKRLMQIFETHHTPD